jgi:hypothetical protein
MKRLLLMSMCAAGLASTSLASVLFTDTFTYPDGALTTVSGGVWINHSGTALQQDVLAGVVNLTQAESEDTHANFAVQGGGQIWAGADVTFSALPAGTGTYFMHFSDGGTSNFKGRVFSTITGAGAGAFRIGITEGSAGPPNTVGADLALGTTYRVLFSSDVLNNDSTVEVVGQGTASHSDAIAATALNAFCMRQSLSGGNSMGTLTIDNVIVGTSRDDVVGTVPEPMTIMGLATGALFLARRRKR